MFKLIKAHVEPLTLQLAQRMSGLLTVKGERGPNAARENHLRNEIRQGQATMFRWVMALFAGKYYRINGGNSSKLFADGEKIPLGATVSMELYECETESDLQRLWSKYDGSLSTRTGRDNLRAFVMSQPALAGLPFQVCSVVMSAAVMDYCGMKLCEGQEVRRINQMPLDDKFGLLLERADFAHWFAATPSAMRGSTKLFHRGGVALAMLHIWALDPREASRFWEEVATGETVAKAGLLPRSGSAMLRLWMQGSEAKGSPTKSYLPKCDWEELYGRSIVAWNIWRKVTKPKEFNKPIELPLPKPF